MSADPKSPRQVYLNGKWLATGEEIAVVNPATGETFARVSMVKREHVRSALQGAHDALGAWRAKTAKERGTTLNRVADELVKRADEIARTITLENGKPLAQSRGEVAMSEDHLRWFAEEGKRAYGRLIPHQAQGRRNLVVKAPIGVVGAISPWNFPLVLAVRKVAPALAAGCTVVLKPSSQTPLCAVMLAECVEAAGIPAGVFQLVMGGARMIAEEFLQNPLCRKITFTGSTEVGKELIRAAAETVKPLSLELGGLAPLLVFEDCEMDRAVEQTLIAKFRNTGQSCIAANRIYVQRSIYGEFVERFVDGVKKLKTGPGLEPGVDIGPLINQEGLDSALRQIEDAAAHGGKVLCGGKRAGTQGYFLEPTVIEGAERGALCMCEETFAPVAPLSSFETEDEAIERANASEYGLSAYAMTRDVGRIFRLAERIEAGTLGINDGAPATSQSPFGGVKQSGWGRELGSEGLDAFLETKHVSIGGV
ncbi:MAG TPA: NAD-dependent succinate-semialdehyde dehydrogenase [Terracidiphilus sp.]|nr:NAD-dependent succinate-semialdehyde dehydrogenase [Terracidiphilus sp.]